MPHVSVTLIKGKTEDQKRDLTDAIARETCRALGVDDKFVTVEFTEVSREDWNTSFYPTRIARNITTLMKKPGY